MSQRDHGGDLGAAIRRHGGAERDWIDLSTGINRRPWPVPPLPPGLFRALPRAEDVEAAVAAARAFYGVAADAACLPVAGAQGAIQLLPRLGQPGRAAILGPTYNEHAAAFRAACWETVEATSLEALRRADVAIVVNPNNPDGRRHAPEALLDLAATVRQLVVDESFGDVAPSLSLCPRLGNGSLIVLRSFGKFFGLAGLRLGFAIGSVEDVARLEELAGPWAASGPALAIGASALADRAWSEATRGRLRQEAKRLDALASAAGWRLVGGTDLFRTYDTGDALAARETLARARIWSRAFPWSDGWLRLGLPGAEEEWRQLTAALSAQ
jgi:cobalamin biosynthesis protein CobC